IKFHKRMNAFRYTSAEHKIVHHTLTGLEMVSLVLPTLRKGKGQVCLGEVPVMGILNGEKLTFGRPDMICFDSTRRQVFIVDFKTRSPQDGIQSGLQLMRDEYQVNHNYIFPIF